MDPCRIQESLLSGFQRENEKAMKDLERAKARERLLEAELEKLVGPNWAVSSSFLYLGRNHASNKNLTLRSDTFLLDRSHSTSVRPFTQNRASRNS